MRVTVQQKIWIGNSIGGGRVYGVIADRASTDRRAEACPPPRARRVANARSSSATQTAVFSLPGCEQSRVRGDQSSALPRTAGWVDDRCSAQLRLSSRTHHQRAVTARAPSSPSGVPTTAASATGDRPRSSACGQPSWNGGGGGGGGVNFEIMRPLFATSKMLPAPTDDKPPVIPSSALSSSSSDLGTCTSSSRMACSPKNPGLSWKLG